jgi:hypothetical protein
VSTLTIGSGAAIPVSVVNGCMPRPFFPARSCFSLFMPRLARNFQYPELL